jgi:hypothetical protein
MTAETLRHFLGWSGVINFGILAVWGLFFTLAHQWMFKMHRRLFKLTVERFDTIHYGGMAFFKILIIVFNIVPYLALRIVG